MHIRRRRSHGMNHPRLAVDTNMRLHAEIPLIALLRLMHFGIPLLGLVLRRTGRTDDGRIHNCSPTHLQALLRQVRADPGKELLPQFVRLQQMSKLTDGRLIGDRLTAQINPHKLPHGARVIERFFHRWIGQIEPLLQTQHSQHPFDPDRWTARSVDLGIDGLDHRDQFGPGHHPIHLVKEPLPAGGLAILLKAGFRKGLLHGECLQFSAVFLIAHHERGINQTFPKIFVDGKGMSAHEFQHLLLEYLNIPVLNYPKGNPMSGQTWPELSFRSLLRHIYRQQRFWGGIADLQPEGEQHACILQFLGLAERLFTEQFGYLVKLKEQIEDLKARRDQHECTLNDLAHDILADPSLATGVNVASVREAAARLIHEIDVLRQKRVLLIAGSRDNVVLPEHLGHVKRLGEERAKLMVLLEDLRRKAKATSDRLVDMRRYRTELGEELDRMSRAADAGQVLADLKITHCPACDQAVSTPDVDTEHCFLCHQGLPNEPLVEGLGAVRLRFEQDRLTGEYKEADELRRVLSRDEKRLTEGIANSEERLRMLENELAPTRQAVAGLIQEEVSAIDMALGELSERQREVGRISMALALGQQLTDRIESTEREIEPLQAIVDEAVRGTDFDAAAAKLEDGMNAYLNAINDLRPGVWRHSPVKIDISRSKLTMRVGARRWHAALGGTDTLYFLMAYHYGLIALSVKAGCHYPGLSVIDVPGEFSGEAVEDKENFIVQPFIDLLSKEEYIGAQLIITGVSFVGLSGAHRLLLTQVHVA